MAVPSRPSPPPAARDLSGVLESVLAGIVVLDGEGRVELANAAACRILEFSAQAAGGRAVEQLLGGDHALARLAREVLAHGGSVTEHECRVERRHAPDLSVDVSASPLFDADGARDGVVVFLRDATLQRDLHARATERQLFSAFGRIAAGVAHEVKNPLGGIRGAAELLASRAGDDKNSELAELIVREVDRIVGLVDELMVFARNDELKLAPTNVHRVLDDVLDLLTLDPLAKDVEVERLYDPSIPELQLDAGRLTQVFFNLTRNALQAMEGDPGTLTITTRTSLDRRPAPPDGESLPTFCVEVADTGPGIPEELVDKLSTPFFTTRPQGTGLGLALARHWVARHGGELRIRSTPGQGTRVRVDLPMRMVS